MDNVIFRFVVVVGPVTFNRIQCKSTIGAAQSIAQCPLVHFVPVTASTKCTDCTPSDNTTVTWAKLLFRQWMFCVYHCQLLSHWHWMFFYYFSMSFLELPPEMHVAILVKRSDAISWYTSSLGGTPICGTTCTAVSKHKCLADRLHQSVDLTA